MSGPWHDRDGSRCSRRRRGLAAFPARPLLLLTTPMWDRSWLVDAGGSVPGWDVSERLANFAQANAVVFHLPQVVNIRHLTKPPGQVWIGVTAECDVNYPRQADQGLLSCLDAVASYHRIRISRSTTRRRRGCQSCCCRPQRKRTTPSSARSSRTHARGAIANRALSSSSGICRCITMDDGITHIGPEKWFDCLVAGCVPVYFGAPNIAEFAPAPDSYVDARRFDARALARHVRETSASEARYAGYFAWKRRPLATAFARLFEDQDVPFLHRLCAWLDVERAAVRIDASRAPESAL